MKIKNLGMWALLALLVIGVVGISGCIQKQGESPTTTPVVTPSETSTPSGSSTTPQPTETQMGSETGETGAKETLSEILSRGVGISVKYDEYQTTTIEGMPSPSSETSKVWLKGNKMRIERMTMGGQTEVHLIDMDAKTVYSYYPALNKATNLSMVAEFIEDARKYIDIQKFNPVLVGTETIDGKFCVIVEYDTGMAKVRAWIWKGKGFPIRIESESTVGGKTVKTVIERKNIEFIDIPDSMFVLPPGVQITEMPGPR